jgi:hypothetical protein
MAKPLLTINIDWREVLTTCEPCCVCEDIIYGKQYRLYLNNEPTDKVVCEPCYSAIEEG